MIIYLGNYVILFGYLNCFVKRFFFFGFKMYLGKKGGDELMVSFDSIFFNWVLLVFREKMEVVKL